MTVVMVTAMACGSDNGTAPKPQVGPDAQCVKGTLAVGQTVQGDLSAASSCNYPLVWDATDTSIGQSYNFSVQTGKGYLVSLLATEDNNVLLVGGTAASEQILEAADYSAPWQSTLPFVATSSTTYSVRVGSDDESNRLADTGAYTLRAQSCNVPLPLVTDSVSYTGTFGPGDCTDPQSDFRSDDSSYVHLYAVHFDSGASRTIYIDAPAAELAFDIGGPGFNPYGYTYPTNENVTWYGYTDISGGSGVITAGDSGTYTMVIGTAAYSATAQPYTITFGAEVPAASRVTPPPTQAAAFRGARRTMAGAMMKGRKIGR
jgi:hypothetical protein